MLITQIYTKSAIAGIVHNQPTTDIPVLSVQDPSNRMNMPIYEGTAANAWNYLIPGIYGATVEIDSFATMLDVLLVVTETHSYVTDSDGIAFSGRINA